MKRTIWTLAAIAAIGTSFGVLPAFSDEQPANKQESAASAKAKIGDQVTCAMDGMQMALEADTPSAEYKGRTYYFCSDEEKQQFLKDPERYARH
jgi:YHS domain-containing protein